MVELKWNKMVQTALEQIKEKRYPESLLSYTGVSCLLGSIIIKKIKAISVRLRGIVKGKGSRGIETERAGEVEENF